METSESEAGTLSSPVPVQTLTLAKTKPWSTSLQVVLQPSEAGIVAEQLVLCLGLRWDAADWEALGSSIGHFKWAAFLAVLEAKYCGDQQLHTAALVEAVDEIYDVFIEDIIKKVGKSGFK